MTAKGTNSNGAQKAAPRMVRDFSSASRRTESVRMANASVDGKDVVFEVDTDLEPVMLSRVQRWINSWFAASAGRPVEGAIAPGELKIVAATLVAEILGIGTDDAMQFRFSANFGLLSFLVSPYNRLGRLTTLTETPSESSSPTVAD